MLLLSLFPLFFILYVFPSLFNFFYFLTDAVLYFSLFLSIRPVIADFVPFIFHYLHRSFFALFLYFPFLHSFPCSPVSWFPTCFYLLLSLLLIFVCHFFSLFVFYCHFLLFCCTPFLSFPHAFPVIIRRVLHNVVQTMISSPAFTTFLATRSVVLIMGSTCSIID